MAQKSWFFNSAPGDPRVYQASDFARYFGKVLSIGLLHIDNVPGLQVKATGTDLRTYAEPGDAIMEGYGYENSDNEYLTHNLPEVSLDRIDRIVLRLDKKNANRYIKLFVLEGEPSTEPVAPTLQRDNLVWELSLAQVRIRANTSSISPSDVFDERLDRTVCGLVFSLISKPALADIQTGGYAVTATVEGQTDFEIPLMSFDKVGDGLTVFVEGKKAEYSSYQVLYPRTVRFNIGLPIGTKVEFEIIRGVLKLEDDYVVNAGEVGIIDAGNYYDSENVEGALQKIGSTLFAPKPIVYGIEIDEVNMNPATSISYIEDAANLNITNPSDWDNYWPFNNIKPCKIRPLTNEFLYYLNPNNYAQKEDGSPADINSLTDGDVFIEVPKIYWKLTRVSTKLQIRISPEKVDDDWVCMAHTKGTLELPFIYMGAYLSFKDLDNRLRSLSGRAVASGAALGNYKLFASNNNCEPSNYYSRFLLTNILFWLRNKTRDGGKFLGKGIRTLSNTGATNTMGMYSPSVNGNIDAGIANKFMGMEHVITYVNDQRGMGELIDGLTINEATQVIKISDGSTERSYPKPLILNTGNQGVFIGYTVSNSDIGIFPLTGSTGNQTTGYCATAFTNLGGSLSNDVYGLFSYISGGNMARLMYRPNTQLVK